VPRHDLARAFLADELAAADIGEGETWELAVAGNAARAVAVVADIARALDGLHELAGPMRIANFAARVLGDSKALAPGSDRACTGMPPPCSSTRSVRSSTRAAR
jgi:hypothetical protein